MLLLGNGFPFFEKNKNWWHQRTLVWFSRQGMCDGVTREKEPVSFPPHFHSLPLQSGSRDHSHFNPLLSLFVSHFTCYHTQEGKNREEYAVMEAPAVLASTFGPKVAAHQQKEKNTNKTINAGILVSPSIALFSHSHPLTSHSRHSSEASEGLDEGAEDALLRSCLLCVIAASIPPPVEASVRVFSQHIGCRLRVQHNNVV